MDFPIKHQKIILNAPTNQLFKIKISTYLQAIKSTYMKFTFSTEINQPINRVVELFRNKENLKEWQKE